MRAIVPSLLLVGCPSLPEDVADDPVPFTAVTWNTGSGGLGSSADPDGWTPEIAAIADEHYGNGLAWLPAITRAQEILETLAPDLVAFQEIFDPATGCGEVPVEARAGFICETWSPGDPSVAQQILGEGWQLACFEGKPDKCLAVRTSWGTFDGCDADRCDEVLRALPIAGCGKGSRTGAGLVRTAEGSLTVVGVHGTSGVAPGDMDCRRQQVEGVFAEDDPVAVAPGVVLGDLNTDPGRQADADPSAAAWLSATDGTGWSFATSLDPEDAPTYVGLPIVSIDHLVVAGIEVQGCTAVGLDDGPVTFPELALWDHRPMACQLALVPDAVDEGT